MQVPKAYEGKPAKVDFTAAGGGSGITQEISFSTSDSKNYTNTTSIETKAGAGAGGVTAGVVAGSERSAGKVSVNTAGGSFSGSLQNMPIEAKPYGYGMNWRIFCYNYRSGNQAFPVVTYAVTEPQAPSPLPEDFEQDVAKTTDDSVTPDLDLRQDCFRFPAVPLLQLPGRLRTQGTRICAVHRW